jgi:LysM repeat protein
MSLTYSHLVFLAVAISPVSLLAAPSQETLAREYEQVRKIALRDAKVRAAYAAADQRLDDKIVSIDPALASYIKSRGRSTVEAPEKPTVSKSAPTKPAPAKSATHPPHDISHVVAKGDTLSTIATKYGVSVADLRKANHIQDERKLPVGQTLTIPKANAAGSPR